MSIVSIRSFISRKECSDLIEAFDLSIQSPRANLKAIIATPRSAAIGMRAVCETSKPSFFYATTLLRKRVLNTVKQLYDVIDPLYVDFTILSQMREGDSMVRHADAVKLENGVELPNHTPWRILTAVLYLNEYGQDFSGGVLRFPALKQEYGPETGMLVCFPCDILHEHEVSQVESGSRFTLTMWMTKFAQHQEYWPEA